MSPIGVAHAATEEYLKNSGLNYVMLRNNHYIETKLPEIKLADEYAEEAANTLLKNIEMSKTYNLSSNLATYDQFAKFMGEIIGEKVIVKHVFIEEYRQLLINKNTNPFVDTVLSKVAESDFLGADKVEILNSY